MHLFKIYDLSDDAHETYESNEQREPKNVSKVLFINLI